MKGPATIKAISNPGTHTALRLLPSTPSTIPGNTQGHLGEYITHVAGHHRSAINRFDVYIPSTAIT
jgi:hypothetical protein